MKLAALIVTHNRLSKLQTTLVRVLAQDFVQVLVVDNASSDATQAWLSSQHADQLEVLRLERNAGGAGGFASGLAWIAKHAQADWVVCFDDDAYPEDDFVTTFQQLQLSAKVAVVSAAVYNPQGQINPLNRPGYVKHFSLLTEFSKLVTGAFKRNVAKGFWQKHKFFDDFYTHDQIRDVDVTTFVGFALRVDLISTVGLPRQDFFIYYDDTEYSLRIRHLGWRIVFVPGLRFVHDSGRNTAKHTNLMLPLWRVFYNYRNRIAVYRMTTPDWLLPLRVAINARSWHKKAADYPHPQDYHRVLDWAVNAGLTNDFSIEHNDLLAKIHSLEAQSGQG